MQNVYDILAGTLIPQQLCDRAAGFIASAEKEGTAFLNALCDTLTQKLSSGGEPEQSEKKVRMTRKGGVRRCITVSLPDDAEANFQKLFIFYSKDYGAPACFSVKKAEEGPALFLLKDGSFERLRALRRVPCLWFYAAAEADRGAPGPAALLWKKHVIASFLVWLAASAGFAASSAILGRLGANSVSDWDNVIFVCITLACAAGVYFIASLTGFFIARDRRDKPDAQ